MKKLLLICFIGGMAMNVFAQSRAILPKEARDRAVKAEAPAVIANGFTKTPAIPAFKNGDMVEEAIIGGTRYDLQSNASVQNRTHVFDDGTIGAVWTMGLVETAYSDRGTGYNYFDGNAWGDEPTERIESLRTGWPSYAPYGENGELVVSHDFSAGTLYYLTRTEKGTGDWTEDEFLGPDGIQISWNRSTTSGVDNSVIQMIYITWPTGNGGPVYEGLDGALLYSRSSDGGQSWDYENTILDEINADSYFGISADNYEWAASKGDNIAFLVGDYWIDMALMKSADGGDTWTKTVIWENPYPLFDYTFATDTFYCTDGTHHLAFDSQNKIHIVFGINRTYSDGSSWYYYPEVDGIAYWNEDMPAFSNDYNALNPYGETGTELIEDYNLIGWSQDVNGDGELTFADDWGSYGVGLSSQPQIVIDEMDYIYVVYSSVTETFDNGSLNYRHLWARGSWGEGVWGNFVQLTADLIHIFDECAFPNVAPYTDENFYLTYQTDNEPGMNIQGTLHAVTDNNINFMEVSRNDLIPLGVEEQGADLMVENVSQNFPNPFSGTTYVNVELSRPAAVSLEVTTLTGQLVYTIPERNLKAGITRFDINVENLSPGVYFYSVKAGESIITKKMVVE